MLVCLLGCDERCDEPTVSFAHNIFPDARVSGTQPRTAWLMEIRRKSKPVQALKNTFLTCRRRHGDVVIASGSSVAVDHSLLQCCCDLPQACHGMSMRADVHATQSTLALPFALASF